jgi:hypothetical protein
LSDDEIARRFQHGVTEVTKDAQSVASGIGRSAAGLRPAFVGEPIRIRETVVIRCGFADPDRLSHKTARSAVPDLRIR